MKREVIYYYGGLRETQNELGLVLFKWFIRDSIRIMIKTRNQKK